MLLDRREKKPNEASFDGAPQVQSKKNPLIVRTDRMAADSIAGRMADMRTWLDRNKVELAAFRPITIRGGVAFDAQFRNIEQAALFRAAFGGSYRWRGL
jgi:hypothetical protein